MQTAWPRPYADLFDRRRIDRNHNDVAAGRLRLPGEAQIGQHIAQSIVPAGQQRDGQDDRDQNLRPVVFHFVPNPQCTRRFSQPRPFR
jgi:hypothetical protein